MRKTLFVTIMFTLVMICSCVSPVEREDVLLFKLELVESGTDPYGYFKYHIFINKDNTEIIPNKDFLHESEGTVKKLSKGEKLELMFRGSNNPKIIPLIKLISPHWEASFSFPGNFQEIISNNHEIYVQSQEYIKAPDILSAEVGKYRDQLKNRKIQQTKLFSLENCRD